MSYFHLYVAAELVSTCVAGKVLLFRFCTYCLVILASIRYCGLFIASYFIAVTNGKLNFGNGFNFADISIINNVDTRVLLVFSIKSVRI